VVFKKSEAEIELERVLDRIAESIFSATDEEILEDARAAGEDPESVAREQKALVLSVIQKHRKTVLAVARQKYEQQASRIRERSCNLPETEEGRLELLVAALQFRPGLENALTVQHREFKSLSDQDVESYLRQFEELGVLAALKRSKSDD